MIEVKKKKFPIGLCILGIIATIITGYYLGACFTEGKANTIFQVIERLRKICRDPFQDYRNGKYTLYAIGGLLYIFFMFFLFYLGSRKNYMFGKEHGSSMLADAKIVCKKLADTDNSKKNLQNIVVKKRYQGLFYQIPVRIRNKAAEIKNKRAGLAEKHNTEKLRRNEEQNKSWQEVEQLRRKIEAK